MRRSAFRIPTELKSASLGSLGKIVGALCNIVTVPIYVSHLGPSAWAIASLQVVLQTTLSWWELGAPTVATRELSTAIRQNRSTVFRSFEFVMWGASIGAGITASVILYALSWWGSTEAIDVASSLVISAGVSLNLLVVYYTNCAIGVAKYQQTTYIAIISSLVRAGAGVAAVRWAPSVPTFLTSQIVVNVLFALCTRALVSETVGPSPFGEIRKVWYKYVSAHSKTAASIATGSLLLGLGVQGDKLLLTQIMSLAEVGEYLVGCAVGGFIYALLSTYVSGKTHMIYQAGASSEQASSGRAMSLSIGCLMCAGYVAIGDITITYWLMEAKVNAQGIVFVGFITGLSWVIYSAFQITSLQANSIGKPRCHVIAAFASLPIYALTILSLAPSFGICGAAVSFLFYTSSLLTIAWSQVGKVGGLSINRIEIRALFALAAVALAGLVRFLPDSVGRLEYASLVAGSLAVLSSAVSLRNVLHLNGTTNDI